MQQQNIWQDMKMETHIMAIWHKVKGLPVHELKTVL